jgi:hypothetical protein
MRKAFPKEVQVAVFKRSGRRCALCFGLHGDGRVKKGQLAHVDRIPNNSTEENAAFLCLPHHDDYDSVSKHTKRLTPGELKAYRDKLYEAIETGTPLPDINDRLPHRKSRKDRGQGVALELHERRIPVYRVTVQFVQTVMKDLKPSLKDIFQFSADTDEAIFLFDDALAEYLAGISRRALRLHTIEWVRTRMASEPEPANFRALVAEQVALFEWFSTQHQEIQSRFLPFLRLR